MTQDFRDQPEATFYSSDAFQLVSTGGNTWAFNSAKGNRLLFDLTENYRPIAACGNLDKILVFSCYEGANVGQKNGEVGIVIFNRVTLLATSYTPLYNTLALNWETINQIEPILFPENSRIQRVYWTDRVQPPGVLNVLDPTFTTYIPVNGLIVGQQYMAVQGEVLHNGVSYGPQSANGTVFTAVSITWVPISVTPAPLVINYVSIDVISWIPGFRVGRIALKQWIAGSALCGSYIFCYQLLDNNGASTPWSYPTFPIRTAGADTVYASSDFASYNKHQGHAFNVSSTQGIRLTIDGIDTNFTRIRIAMVFGTAINVFNQPVVTFDGPITGPTMDVDYTGSELLLQLTQEDLAQISDYIKSVGTIAALNNILFAGDIKKNKDVLWDPSIGVTSKCIDYELHTDEIPIFPGTPGGPNTSSYYALNGHNPVQNPVQFTGGIRRKQWYRVKPNANPAAQVVYLGTTYNQGDVFEGQALSGNANAENHISVLGGRIEAVIRIKKYNANGTDRWNYIPYNNDFYDGKGILANHYLRSRKRGERYREALVLIDLAGNIGFARWIADTIIPNQSVGASDPDPNNPGQTIGFNGRLIEYDSGITSANYRATVRHIGVQFNGIDFSALALELGISLTDLATRYSGWAIVRCPLDASIISQGIAYPVMKADVGGTGSINTYHPMAWEQRGWDNEDAAGHGAENTSFCFYSPDAQLRYNGRPSLTKVERAEIVGYLEDPSPGYVGAGGGNNVTDNTFFVQGGGVLGPNIPNWYSKKINFGTAPTSPPFTPIGNIANVDKGNSIAEVDYGDSAPYLGLNFENKAICLDVAPPFMGSTGADRGQSVGARCSVIRVDAQGFVTSHAGNYYPNRAIVNLRNNKTVFYGGNSIAAKAQNLYMFTGHFQPFDAQFTADLVAANGIINNVHVYGGDTTVGLYGLQRLLFDEAFFQTGDSPPYGFAVIVPLEAEANFLLRDGRTFSKDRSHTPLNLNGIKSTNPEQFIYNSAYSNDYLLALYEAIPNPYFPAGEFPYRSIFSVKKNPGELIDSFRKFLTGNFRDVSGLFGAITNLRAKEMRLFYWQENAVGYLPVNERITVSSAVGAPTTVGEGGVLQRYDERTSFYGNQHQWGLVETDQGFVWIDARKRSLIYMDTGLQIIPLQAAAGMNSFLNNRLVGNMLVDDKPIAGSGISGVYDPEYKRAYITVLGTGNDFTISFDHFNKQFAGFFPFKSGLYHVYDKHVISFSPPALFPVLTAQPYLVGDIATSTVNGEPYVNILAYTQVGAGDPSTDPAHWFLLSKKNQMWLHDVGAVAQWYNYVHFSRIQFKITTDQMNLEKIFDNFDMRGSREWFDKLIASTATQTATDDDIQNNENYEYRNRAWLSSVPLDLNTGRMQDFVLDIILEKDNRVSGNPLISKNETVILSTVQTDFRKAY